jgi:hypothetical protein
MDEKCKGGAEGAMKVLKGIGLTVLVIAAAFLFGLVILLLWNWLMPHLFGLPGITYWEGLGLLILSCILFGRMGGGPSGDKKKDKDSVRNTIKEEIKKEIVKEFEKEFGGKDGKENAKYDEMYERWWEAQGKDSFEKYSRQEEEKE